LHEALSGFLHWSVPQQDIVTPALHLEFEQLYAVTSHSSQGQTADRVLIHADTELGAKNLLNNRMAYVAVSRGAYDAQIFTNDREKLGAALGHDVSHSSAHAPEMKPEQKQEQAVTPQREIAPKQEQGEDFGLGL
jgi:ATP-dependent exoDNAse (exonuclease V) alpha subunit